MMSRDRVKASYSFLHFLNPHLKITLVRLDAHLFLNLELVYPALPFALCIKQEHA